MNTLRNTAFSTKKGFTLVEMAIVLVIVGLLIGGGFSALGAYLDNAKQSHTLGSLKVTKQALLNYVKVNKHMPCPDVTGDGKGDVGGALGTQCSSDVGTIPFDDIGLGRSVTADDYGNLFGYAVHKEAATSAVMGLNIALTSEATALRGFAGSYFYNLGAPAFDLDTPPTEAIPGSLVNSYQVCNRDAANNCGGANDVEVQFIPAVIVAFNENGFGTNLASCGTASRGDRETENCDADMRLIRGSFQDGVFDDQIVTISAYEIKEQALGDFKDPPQAVADPNLGEYAGYDVIIKGDVDSANATNLGTSVDEAFYIDTTDGDPTTGGNLDAQVTLKAGNDKLYVTNDILAGGNADMGAGDDELFVGGNVSGGGSAALGDGLDILNIDGSILYRGSVDLGKDADTATIKGSVGGSLTGDTGDDTVTINGDVTGTVNLGADNDTLYLLGDLVGGDLDGGAGTDDKLYLSATEIELNALITAEGGSVNNFETIIYGYIP